MNYHLEFEKPIAELQRKLEELRLDADGGTLGISIADEIKRIEEKLDDRINEIRNALGQDLNKGIAKSSRVVNRNNVKPNH